MNSFRFGRNALGTCMLRATQACPYFRSGVQPFFLSSGLSHGTSDNIHSDNNHNFLVLHHCKKEPKLTFTKDGESSLSETRSHSWVTPTTRLEVKEGGDLIISLVIVQKSKSLKSKSAADRQMEERVNQFCSVTGATAKDARKFLDKYKRVDAAIDSYYTDPNQFGGASSKKSDSERTTKLNSLFEKYKDPEGEDITVDGTIKLCEDLDVNPEDVVLLAIAHELKSPSMGVWTKKGWMEGWRTLGCDSIESMKATLAQLSQRLGSDSRYFHQVYAYTFDFARQEGQRSLALELAQGFWALLIPHGLHGGALSHIGPEDGDGDTSMDGGEEGWKEEYTEWWFEFLTEKGGKGVSKDTWLMLLEFVRAIDSRFKKYDETAAWPSTIDDFVAWVRENKLTA